MIKLSVDDAKLSEDTVAWLRDAENKLSVEMGKRFIASLTEPQKEIILLLLMGELDRPMTATELELRKKLREDGFEI